MKRSWDADPAALERAEALLEEYRQALDGGDERRDRVWQRMQTAAPEPSRARPSWTAIATLVAAAAAVLLVAMSVGFAVALPSTRVPAALVPHVEVAKPTHAALGNDGDMGAAAIHPRAVPAIRERAVVDPAIAERSDRVARSIPAPPTSATRPARRTAHTLPAPPQRDRRSPLATSSDLRAEMQLIERARRALDRGAATEALRLLLRHARSFRTGQLVEERLALHAITLCATGDFARGRKLSRAFLRRYPRSPMRTRVTSACGE